MPQDHQVTTSTIARKLHLKLKPVWWGVIGACVMSPLSLKWYILKSAKDFNKGPNLRMLQHGDDSRHSKLIVTDCTCKKNQKHVFLPYPLTSRILQYKIITPGSPSDMGKQTLAARTDQWKAGGAQASTCSNECSWNGSS